MEHWLGADPVILSRRIASRGGRMLRSAGVVLGAYILIGVLVVATDYVVGGLKPGDISPGQPPPAAYFVVSIITAPIYSAIGGYVCAVLAKAKPMQHVVALICFGQLMGIASVVMFWGKQPLWYGLGLLVLYPIMVWAGCKLRMRQARV
jgi:hypothetical protein